MHTLRRTAIGVVAGRGRAGGRRRARRVPAAARRRARTGPVDARRSTPRSCRARRSTRRSPTCRRISPPHPTTRTSSPSSASPTRPQATAHRRPDLLPQGRGGAAAVARRSSPTTTPTRSSGWASSRTAKHDFAGGVRWGRQRSRSNPTPRTSSASSATGSSSSATIPRRSRRSHRMVRMRPDIASYARVSYARELQGNMPRRARAMHRAAPRGGLARRRRVGELPARRSVLPRAATVGRGRTRLPAERGAVPDVRARRTPGSRRSPGNAGTLDARDPRVPAGGRPLPPARARDRARRPVHDRRDAPQQADDAYALAAHRGHAVPRQRRQRRRRARAVRGRSRRPGGRARRRDGRVGGRATASTPPTRSPGRSYRIGPLPARPRATSGRRCTSARRTRSTCTTRR